MEHIPLPWQEMAAPPPSLPAVLPKALESAQRPCAVTPLLSLLAAVPMAWALGWQWPVSVAAHALQQPPFEHVRALMLTHPALLQALQQLCFVAYQMTGLLHASASAPAQP